MGFRFRRSARLGPLRLHFSAAGLSSISIGGRGASFNIPLARAGGARSTVGLPGSGLSCSVEQTPSQGLPNSRRLRSGQLEAFKQSLLGLLQQELFGPGSAGTRLQEQGHVTALMASRSIGPRSAALLALIETPEAMAAYLLRARSQDDAKARARRCIDAVLEAERLAGAA